MAPTRKTRIPPSLDIPVLTEVVAASADAPGAAVPPPTAAAAPPVVAIPQDVLAGMLTERIAALTDQLLGEASAEIHATLVNKVWEKLRDEIPAIVEQALKENGKE